MHSVDHVEDVAPVHAVEPVAQNVIFANGTNLAKTTCKFIFQLEVRLAHFVDFAADFGTFGHHSFLFLPLFLLLSRFLTLKNLCLRLLVLIDVFVDEQTNLIVLLFCFALLCFLNLGFVPLSAQLLLVALILCQFFESVNRFIDNNILWLFISRITQI